MYVLLSNKLFCSACFWTSYNWNHIASSLVWLLFPISIMLLRFIHVSEYSCSSFVSKLSHSIIGINHNLFIHSAVDGYLGCFQFYLFSYYTQCSLCTPRHGIARSQGSCMCPQIYSVPPLSCSTGYHWDIDTCRLWVPGFHVTSLPALLGKWWRIGESEKTPGYYSSFLCASSSVFDSSCLCLGVPAPDT